MAPVSRDRKDHQRRVLEHQSKMAAERQVSGIAPPDPQLRIPLVGEVKQNEGARKPKRKKRASLPAQAKFKGI